MFDNGVAQRDLSVTRDGNSVFPADANNRRRLNGCVHDEFISAGSAA
jgi:hypothetical protein